MIIIMVATIDHFNDHVKLEGIEWNESEHSLLVNNVKVSLTKTQYKLFYPLQYGWPVTYNELANIVYNYDADLQVRMMIDKHIDRIRDKLRGTGIYIYCVLGYGYLLLNDKPAVRRGVKSIHGNE
jgi:DNA-binding response OmpR family regulator